MSLFLNKYSFLVSDKNLNLLSFLITQLKNSWNWVINFESWWKKEPKISPAPAYTVNLVKRYIRKTNTDIKNFTRIRKINASFTVTGCSADSNHPN